MKDLRKRQSAAVKAALAKADRVGRKRKTEYELIWQKRDEGLSLTALAAHFGVTRGSIQHALRRRPK